MATTPNPKMATPPPSAGTPAAAPPPTATAAAAESHASTPVSKEQKLRNIAHILSRYDHNKNGQLDAEEVEMLQRDYALGRMDAETRAALSPWDTNHDGVLDQLELDQLQEDTNSVVRYAAFSRFLPRVFASSAVRYLAFSSDVGEAFRPMTSKLIVRSSYALAWAYCVCDTGMAGYREKEAGSSKKTIVRAVSETAVFHTLASMGGPAFAIHSTVHLAEKVVPRFKFLARWPRAMRFMPSACGLALIPFLPFIFDGPFGKAIHWAFDRLYPDSPLRTPGHTWHPPHDHHTLTYAPQQH